ncbi:MATE family efflux transporter [Pseudovibrio exalbescens]|uniref:Multidrug export protein MepA n=1 Tax=Pseudovibrio exalbescens TaxID=197461 RepID=A0A1U7JDB5_9HYPH|nr:MATE family efflux transporter [Pseudovibrio exalbescens]OKL42746.1 MATE family efflux transporter [Pseudovibrio exalbescens]
MSSEAVTPNTFTQGSLATTFAKTALPIIFVMSMNGLLSVVDAVFLGVFVGPNALGAVTLMLPLYMLIAALATLVASGMSSLLARHLGGSRFDEARAVFAGAHGLALTLSAGLILLFLAVGRDLTLTAAAGPVPMAEMGYVYLRITVLFSPVLFVLSVNSDALRNEGGIGFMAAASLLVSLSNIGFNYLLIAVLHLGVAGSAYGTVLAQGVAFAIILTFRICGKTKLRPSALWCTTPMTAWKSILALGAPQSLNFIGLALGSAAIITALQLVESDTYATTVSAYGIITRVMTFAFLPLLGLSHALQSITGNNYGAEQWRRSDDSLRLGVAAALAYCLIAEIILIGLARPIGLLFVDDGDVVSEVARIMPMIVAMFFAAGPLVMIAAYFQAIGDAGPAAILGLSKPYLFAMPLTFLLPFPLGEQGIWMAGPVAEVLLLALTGCVLCRTAHQKDLRWGLFKSPSPAPQ